MQAAKEFHRFASTYGHYNVIQRQAAEYLVSWIGETAVGTVVDLGCGDGEVFRQLQKRRLAYKHFVAVDLADSMLALHPQTDKVHCMKSDFNDEISLRQLSVYDPDLLISSSALQWSDDLDRTFTHLSQLASSVYFSIFTDGTFATLHRQAGLKSPIRSFEETKDALLRFYYVRRMERVSYRLYFNSRQEIFRYIKRSGVSGGKARLGYRAIRRLMEEYPLDYLEFELLFASLVPRSSFSRS